VPLNPGDLSPRMSRDLAQRVVRLANAQWTASQVGYPGTRYTSLEWEGVSGEYFAIDTDTNSWVSVTALLYSLSAERRKALSRLA